MYLNEERNYCVSDKTEKTWNNNLKEIHKLKSTFTHTEPHSHTVLVTRNFTFHK